MCAASFIPRAAFPTLDSLPRSYFLGHHKTGLAKMKTLLGSTDLIIECRDYRVPLTSRNPLFEDSLAGRERLIVYTKQDLGSNGTRADSEREAMIRCWHHPHPVLFSAHRSRRSVRAVLAFARARTAARSLSLAGARLLVVGMPNVGKSTLLNALRALSPRPGRRGTKAAATGAQPGVTRSVGTGVKILAADEASGAPAVYLVDTPGVFVPHVPDAEAMLRLALCGCVKDALVPPAALADYLLYRINGVDPGLYGGYHAPTNDVGELLAAVARRTGRLGRGGALDTEGAAVWLVQRWRGGKLGRFVLDEVTPDALERRREEARAMPPSISQARKADKEARRVRARTKYATDVG